ncbi:MAG: TFIIB-type zinc ribbon-containing protein [Ignisphaera sp.]|uniref:TFIIB-type zinc ribbon-containing protein n=1 Tax=Ignisphaera aggregans TaxID=334771 RepID=A0A7J3JQ28_9CREN
MECIYCGSQNLLYDYMHGYIVCSNCGTINDDIFMEHYIPVKDGEIFKFKGLPTVREGFERKLAKNRLRQLAKVRRDVKIYENFAKKSRRGVYVDWDALQKRLQGDKSRIYKHVAEDSIKRAVDMDRLVRIIIEEIIEQDPVLSSRTLRGKVALAIILKHMILDSNIDMSRIAKETSLSKMHIKRLLTLIRTRMEFINKKLIELKSIVPKAISISQ